MDRGLTRTIGRAPVAVKRRTLRTDSRRRAAVSATVSTLSSLLGRGEGAAAILDDGQCDGACRVVSNDHASCVESVRCLAQLSLQKLDAAAQEWNCHRHRVSHDLPPWPFATSFPPRVAGEHNIHHFLRRITATLFDPAVFVTFDPGRTFFAFTWRLDVAVDSLPPEQ